LVILGLILFGANYVAAQTPAPRAPRATALGTGFTYQGQLKQNGTAVNGTCDMYFTLFDALTAGNIVGIQSISNVAVTNGLFTVTLNSSNEFSANAFIGDAGWLQIEVRCPAGSGLYTTLLPRQAITATPYALGLRPGAYTRASFAGTEYPVLQIENTNTTDGVGLRSDAGTRLSFSYSAPIGILGTSSQGAGVYGKSQTRAGVLGVSDTGIGVYGASTSPAGVGVNAVGSGINSSAQGTALRIDTGAIKVTGAGQGTMTPVFIHVATPGTISTSATCIDHPLTNNDPNAILFVTHNFNPGGGTGTAALNAAYGLWYNGARWCIFREDAFDMPVNVAFNVLVIKP
jgi:hypothetical protein